MNLQIKKSSQNSHHSPSPKKPLIIFITSVTQLKVIISTEGKSFLSILLKMLEQSIYVVFNLSCGETAWEPLYRYSFWRHQEFLKVPRDVASPEEMSRGDYHYDYFIT